MNFPDHLRQLEPRLRTGLLATVLLVVPGIGQFVAIRDLNTTGQYSPLAVLFLYVGIFAVPTSAILSAAVAWSVRRDWRRHERTVTLCGLNLVLVANLIWFFFHACSWAAVFGLNLKTCTSP